MSSLKEIITSIQRFIQYGDLPTSYYIKRGMKVGKRFNRQSGTKFDPSHCWLIEIGDDVTIAPRTVILAHDDSIRRHTNYGRVGRVVIGNNVFVGANSLILMNTNIGDNAIIAAGSVVTNDVAPNMVVAGVPAKPIGDVSDFISRCKEELDSNTCEKFDLSYTVYDNNKITEEKKEYMKNVLKGKHGYINLGQYID